MLDQGMRYHLQRARSIEYVTLYLDGMPLPSKKVQVFKNELLWLQEHIAQFLQCWRFSTPVDQHFLHLHLNIGITVNGGAFSSWKLNLIPLCHNSFIAFKVQEAWIIKALVTPSWYSGFKFLSADTIL